MNEVTAVAPISSVQPKRDQDLRRKPTDSWMIDRFTMLEDSLLVASVLWILGLIILLEILLDLRELGGMS